MSVRIVRLGSRRLSGEGLLKDARAALADGDEKAWKSFVRRYQAEMTSPDARTLLDVTRRKNGLGLLCENTAARLVRRGQACGDEAREFRQRRQILGRI